jgi:hypothetical protein
MGPILEAAKRFFTEDEWPFSEIEGKAMLRTGFSGDNGNWTCIARAREEQEQFIFYSIAPNNVPEDRRLAAAEFLTRANYGLVIGNFELDFSDGEVRYKTSIDVEGDRLTSPLLKQMVYANVLTMDRYMPGLMAVSYGNVTAVDAIAQVEG